MDLHDVGLENIRRKAPRQSMIPFALLVPKETKTKVASGLYPPNNQDCHSHRV
eukprot:m.69349 g.69349  ORF g.69349 m.69349 type:complete len:53 (+) comp13730_c0_seq2:894-1052(+)